MPQTLPITVAVLLLLVVAIVCARKISECDGKPEGHIQNPNTNCEYPYIYCNDGLSAFCTEAECSDAFVCDAATDTSSTVQPGTDAKIKYCEGKPEGYITNPDASCQYQWIYCNGKQSVYCSDETCSESFTCAETDDASTTTSITSPSTTKPTTTTTTTTTLNVREACHTGVTANYPYPANCRYFYQCLQGLLIIQDCGFDMKFDVNGGHCTKSNAVKCASMEHAERDKRTTE